MGILPTGYDVTRRLAKDYRKQGWAILGMLLSLLVTPSLFAIPTPDLAQQREDFVAAETALRKDDLAGYKNLAAKLQHYPLLPYLYYQEFLQRLDKVTSAEAEQFLERYRSTPLSWKFRRKWLDELAKRERWWIYLAFYQPQKSLRRQCDYAHALQKTGKVGKAQSLIRKIWLHGSSLPESCDPILKAWRKTGKQTETLTWKRIELAMDKGNIKLARYLRRYLQKPNQQWLDQWIALYRTPEKRLHDPKPANTPVDSTRIWLHGLRRLARRDIDKALRLWREKRQENWLDDKQRYATDRYLLSRQLYADHPDAWDKLKHFTPQANDLSMLERRLRYAVTKGKWRQLLKWLKGSPESLQQEERWRYWRAYALRQTGKNAESKKQLGELAKERSYHGFLAADMIKKPYNLNHEPLKVDQQRVAQLQHHPASRRAEELFALGRLQDARREWSIVTKGLDKAGLQAAATVARQWGWVDQAIFTLARSRYWEDLKFRFPIRHRDQVKRGSKRHQLDNAWVFAVIRQESAFSPLARSRVGALGLMQLMPKTARQVARRLKEKPPSHSKLLTPNTNIRLGTAYLRQVMDRLGDNPVLATAAYNAGPHRVLSWLPEQQLSAPRWVEGIPFGETRQYTERVMSYAVIYEHLLGREPKRLSERMQPVSPRNLITAKSAISSGKKAL